MTTRLTDADLAEIARLGDVAEMPAPTFHIGGCQCGSCREMHLGVIAAEAARRELMATRAIGRLLAELSATRRERDEAYRTADQLREGVRTAEVEMQRLQEERDSVVIGCAKRLALPHPQELMAGNERLRAEQAADRAAVRALVESLPRCEVHAGCERPATCGTWDSVVHVDGHRCDAHRVDDAEDVEYAAPLRALLDRMATWGDAKADGPAPEHGDSALHRLDVAAIRKTIEDGTDHATAIDWPAFFERRKRLGSDAEAIEAPARDTIRWMEQENGREEKG